MWTAFAQHKYTYAIRLLFLVALLDSASSYPPPLVPPPTCEQLATYRPIVEQALRDYYKRWPYNNSGHFLHFPELRQTLVNALMMGADVRLLLWALNDEGPYNTYVAGRFHREIVRRISADARYPEHVIESKAWRRVVAPSALNLLPSAEMSRKPVETPEIAHAFHITAMHGFGALVATHARSNRSLDALAECADVNRFCDSAWHGAVWTLVGSLPDDCWVSPAAMNACVEERVPEIHGCWTGRHRFHSRDACWHAVGHAVLHHVTRQLALPRGVDERPSTAGFVTPRWLHATLPVDWPDIEAAALLCKTVLEGTNENCLDGVFHSANRISTRLAVVAQGAKEDPNVCNRNWSSAAARVCQKHFKLTFTKGGYTGWRHGRQFQSNCSRHFSEYGWTAGAR